jgi:hypothetical protein
MVLNKKKICHIKMPDASGTGHNDSLVIGKCLSFQIFDRLLSRSGEY